MVVAVVALSFALVGSAVAGTDTLNKAVTKSKVKKIAKKQINKRAVTLGSAAGGALSGAYPDPGFAKDVVPLTLGTGWAAEDGTTPTPAVWKDAYNVVHFTGSLQRTSGTSTQPFTLPEQFRPTTTKFPGLTIEGGLGFLQIDPNGTVTAFPLTTGSNIAGFLGIEDVEFEAGT
jgi:hypothetical protein